MKHLFSFLLIALLVDASWIHIKGNPNSVLELTYDDGTTDQLVFDNKDIDTPKMWAKVNKVIEERKNER